MKKRSMMGSSKYEFDSDKIDKDFSDRDNFYAERMQQWDKELINKSIKQVYGELIKAEELGKVYADYKKRNYTFRFTFEGYQEKVILFLGGKDGAQ